MVTIYRDQDADLGALAGARVAVIGYGIQGRAQALNLRDSGLDVVVGNRDDAYAARAHGDGFEVMRIERAAAAGDVIVLLVPDEAQPEVYGTAVGDGLRPGNALVFAHGFALRYRLIEPPIDVDVGLLAPRMPGRYVRQRFVEGRGAPAYVDVVQDATGRALERLLALAKGIGATREAVLAVTVAQETELDLFSEHFTFPLIFRALEIACEELIAQGYPPEVAVMELHGSGELGQVLERSARVGLYGMLEADGSPAARYGVLRQRRQVLDRHEVIETVRAILDRIRDGSFARELLEDQRIGHPSLEAMTAESHELEISRAEASLRALLGGAGDDEAD